ncbi:hypothetical protein [Streptomyces atacamensis]|uniref:hypothetical protein n=1 Tax=Streptomyces atacamensis TaxID=531966 RepID=UPI00399D0D10
MDAIEQRAHAHLFRFTTADGRTVVASVDQILDVLLGGDLPPHLARVTGTPETADLARSIVDLARREAADG